MSVVVLVYASRLRATEYRKRDSKKQEKVLDKTNRL